MEVIFLEPARKDIRIAYEWYEDRKSGLGIKFTKEVISYSQKLKNVNIEYRIYFSNVRYLKLQTFPFSIFFFREADKAFIIGVLHNRQDSMTILRPGT